MTASGTSLLSTSANEASVHRRGRGGGEFTLRVGSCAPVPCGGLPSMVGGLASTAGGLASAAGGPASTSNGPPSSSEGAAFTVAAAEPSLPAPPAIGASSDE